MTVTRRPMQSLKGRIGHQRRGWLNRTARLHRLYTCMGRFNGRPMGISVQFPVKLRFIESRVIEMRETM